MTRRPTWPALPSAACWWPWEDGARSWRTPFYVSPNHLPPYASIGIGGMKIVRMMAKVNRMDPRNPIPKVDNLLIGRMVGRKGWWTVSAGTMRNMTIPVFVDVRGHQGRVGSGLAAKEADAVVSISFARRIRRP